MRCKIAVAEGADLGRPAAWIHALSVYSTLDLHRKPNYKIDNIHEILFITHVLLAMGSLFAAKAQKGDGSKDLDALQGTW